LSVAIARASRPRRSRISGSDGDVDPVSLVHANAVLALAVSSQGFESIAWHRALGLPIRAADDRERRSV